MRGASKLLSSEKRAGIRTSSLVYTSEVTVTVIALVYVSTKAYPGMANVIVGFKTISPMPAFASELQSCVEVVPSIVMGNAEEEIEQPLLFGNVQVVF